MENRSMDAWDRSHFAMNPGELLVEEAVRAMQRVLEESRITEAARRAVRDAMLAIRSQRA
jgi:hypothetical protein